MNATEVIQVLSLKAMPKPQNRRLTMIEPNNSMK